MEKKHVTIEHIKWIIQLSKVSKKILREYNARQERIYNGPELTKKQLIYQLTFLMDSPDEINN